MILITGGLGFIGHHTARVLLALNETCVLTQHTEKPIPESLRKEIGSRLFVEQLDMADTNAFLKLGEKYSITGIIHLAVSMRYNPAPSVLDLFKDIQANMSGLANALQAAQSWKVKRILVASSLNVYDNENVVPWREDQLLSLTAPDPAAAFKKSDEIVADYLVQANRY